MQTNKGMTLIEIIFVLFLMGIMMICLYQTFLPGIKAWQRSDVKAQVQQSALLAVQRITKELRASDIESVVMIQSPARSSASITTADAISFLSPFGPDGTHWYDVQKGTILWQKHAIIYLDSQSHILYLQEQPITPPTDSPPCYQVETFTPAPGKDRVIARNILSVSFEALPDAEKENKTLKNPVKIKITASRENYSSMLETAVSSQYSKD